VGSGVLDAVAVGDPVGVCDCVGGGVTLPLKEVLAVPDGEAPELSAAEGEAERV